MSREHSNTESQDSLNRFLHFSLGGEEFALPLMEVREVLALPEVTPVPHAPPSILGLINLRGQVITLADLGVVLDIGKTKVGPETAVVICEFSRLTLGIRVDRVISVLDIPASELELRAELPGKHLPQYVTGIIKRGEKLVLVLNVAKALKGTATPAAEAA